MPNQTNARVSLKKYDKLGYRNLVQLAVYNLLGGRNAINKRKCFI